MFVSQSRSLIFTQYEHARLAGLIAQHWGNGAFSRPAIGFQSFCAGVAFHDHGYGLLDTHDILSMTEPERLATFEAMMNVQIPDPIASIVAGMHTARLLRWSGLSEMQQRFSSSLDTLIDATTHSRQDFEDADSITELCDAIAFDFCFEMDKQGEVAISPSLITTELASNRIHYSLQFPTPYPGPDENQESDSISMPGTGTASGTGTGARTGARTGSGSAVSLDGSCAQIRIRPWPLAVTSMTGYLIGFEKTSYPDSLVPQHVPFIIRPD